MEPQAPAAQPEVMSTMGELIDAYLEANDQVERLKPIYNRVYSRQAATTGALAACLRDLGPVVHDGSVYTVKPTTAGGTGWMIHRATLIDSKIPLPVGADPLPKQAKGGDGFALSLMRKHPQT